MARRLFGVILSFDIVLCLIVAGCLATYGEQCAAAVAVRLPAAIEAPALLAELSRAGGTTVTAVSGRLPGVVVPVPLALLLPQETRGGSRDIEFFASADESPGHKLEKIAYTVFVKSADQDYKITISLQPFLHLAYIGGTILLVYEFLTLLSRSRKDRRMIRVTLDPITELTRAAQDLNAVSRQLDPAMMTALAGRLENINAARLDTRIPVDDTQAELKNLARAINSMLDRINHAYGAQVRFVSDASHELRTPISVIQGYANLLDRWGKNDPKTLQESITAIKEEAGGMKELVEQLLFLARGDNDTILLQPECFNLAELAQEVVGETRMIDPYHDYGALLDAALVTADRALIKQALRILMDNAAKYTDQGGKITVRTADTGAFVQLAVQDNGIGISPEIVPHIFDRFYRADESRARATGGAGLGLSIANWITARHGGSMEVLSREGLGTRMTLVLPKRVGEEPSGVQL